MLSIDFLHQSGLIRALSTTQASLAQATTRIATGQRIQSAADDPAGLVRVNRLRAEIGGLNAQMTNAVRLESMVQVASSGVSEQVSLLQDMRALAVSASSATASASDRATYQTSLEALREDFDRVATTTTFDGRALLDGSFGSQTFYLGATGSRGVSIELASTRGTAIGQVAETIGTPVTTTALQTGDLVVNGVAIEAALTGDDAVSTADASASAISTAAAINRANAGVTATAGPTTINLGAISAGTINAGDLSINGVDIGTVDVVVGDSDGALAAAINDVQGSTGVTASFNGSNELVLTAADGRNVATGGNATSGAGVLANDPGTQTHTGSVVLTSSSDITITGNDEASAGLSAGTYAVSTSSSVATLDISTQSSAEAAVRQIDAALAQMSAIEATLGAAEQSVDDAYQSLSASRDLLSGSVDRIAGANIAAEQARVSAESFQLRAQLSLLAQANERGTWLLQLLAQP